MVNPSRAWDQVPVFGWWQTAPGVPAAGTVHLTVPDRIRRSDGRMIYPAGARRSLVIGDQTQQDPAVRSVIRTAMRVRDAALLGPAFDGVVWDQEWDAALSSAIFTSFYISDDPDITPMGWQVKVAEQLQAGGGREYYIETLGALLALPVPGVNLGNVEVPPGAPTVPAPIYAKGQPGGVAALDGDGDVVDASGEKVAGGANLTAVGEAVQEPTSQLRQILDAIYATVSGVEMRVASGQLQYRAVGGTAWTNVLDLALLEGDPGQPGSPGPAGTITSVSVTALAAGVAPSVSLGGSASARTITLGIPAGAKGEAAAITAITATALPAGQTPTASLGGTAAERTIALGIPAGTPGIGNTVTIIGNGARVHPVTNAALPAGTTVIWVTSAAPINMIDGDMWLQPTRAALPTASYVDQANAVATSSQDATLTIPAGAQVGDLILVAAVAASSTVNFTISGKTFVDRGRNSRTGHASQLFTRIVEAGDAGSVIGVVDDASVAFATQLIVVRNVEFGGVQLSNAGSGSTQITVPDFTPSATSLPLHLVALTRSAAAAATLTPPSEVTKVASLDPTSTRVSGLSWGLNVKPGVDVGNVWVNSSDHIQSSWLITLNLPYGG